jgi:hypothetical protein
VYGGAAAKGRYGFWYRISLRSKDAPSSSSAESKEFKGLNQ